MLVKFTQFHPAHALKGTLVGSIFLITFGVLVTTGWTLSSNYDDPAKIEDISDTSQNIKTEAMITSTDQADFNECKVSTKYPKRILRWCGMITYFANKNNLSPDLIAALIWQESGGNHNAYSASGAVGLMQVMPRDGIAAHFICNNAPCFSNRPTIKQLQDPQFNVKYGTRMLASLIKQHSSVRDALYAYGPTNIGYSYADKVLKIYKAHTR